ncbi:hypothetical protein O53_2169 [Microcystis aeruginosa TAIHU98]|uniref:Uncharacterized protein n=1 Tax=Microcystis aeruginosa TAIHU98 TaxID=1134457 RepID=L7E1P1_MICAE|nr:hypothetical protein O53_2169 [Microcystis aeruginosa TAIHU98]ODV37027.1 hypothetical protein BFG60_3515 [Microcystis aeruginosa NIES-98]
MVPSNGASEIVLTPPTAEVMVFCQRGSRVFWWDGEYS